MHGLGLIARGVVECLVGALEVDEPGDHGSAGAFLVRVPAVDVGVVLQSYSFLRDCLVQGIGIDEKSLSRRSEVSNVLEAHVDEQAKHE